MEDERRLLRFHRCGGRPDRVAGRPRAVRSRDPRRGRGHQVQHVGGLRFAPIVLELADGRLLQSGYAFGLPL